MIACDMWHVACRRVRAVQGDCVRGAAIAGGSSGANFAEHERTERGTHGKVSIFATDIDDQALAEARTALYPPNIEPLISAERRQRFLTPTPGDIGWHGGFGMWGGCLASPWGRSAILSDGAGKWSRQLWTPISECTDPEIRLASPQSPPDMFDMFDTSSPLAGTRR